MEYFAGIDVGSLSTDVVITDMAGDIVGYSVISTGANSTEAAEEGLEKKYVTLVGRVYVKVNKENGDIKVGDPITSSSMPGIGMKADKPCKIAGYAMQDAGFDERGNAEILAFINLGYYVPESAFKELREQIDEETEENVALKECLEQLEFTVEQR